MGHNKELKENRCEYKRREKTIYTPLKYNDKKNHCYWAQPELYDNLGK